MRHLLPAILALVIAVGNDCQCDAYTPIIIWHGMGDSCCNPISMGSIKRLLESQLQGVHVYSVKIGNSVVEDMENGFLSNSNDQVSQVCRQLASDKQFQSGYNAIGFSQGAQFLRAVAQRCPQPAMKNLVSIGGQHQGVYGLPHCPGTNQTLCDIVRKLLNYGAYVDSVQNHVVQAQYWHDPLNENVYREKSIFLADINNEKTVNATYIANLQRLKNLVLVKFLQDTMVQPRESEWFGFYAEGQANTVLPMRQTKLYLQNRLGLREMDAQGKIHFLSSDGDHLRFSQQWFIDNVVKPFLAN